MANPYFDKPEWWKNAGKRVEPAINPFARTDEEDAAAGERRKEMHRRIMTSTPYGATQSEFERMVNKSAISDSMARANDSVDPLTYDDLRRAQNSLSQQRGTISIPILRSDSDIRKTLKRGTRLNASKQMTAEDPYGTTIRFDAEFVLKARIDFIEGDYSTNMGQYEDLTSALEDQILKLAREIVRERKGMI